MDKYACAACLLGNLALFVWFPNFLMVVFAVITAIALGRIIGSDEMAKIYKEKR